MFSLFRLLNEFIRKKEEIQEPELMTDDELFHELTVINNKPFYYGQSIVKEVLIRLFTKHMQRQSPNPKVSQSAKW